MRSPSWVGVLANTAQDRILVTESDRPSRGPDNDTKLQIAPFHQGMERLYPDELLKRWLADHPGETEMPKNVKAILSNLKSVLRSKGRKKTAKAEKVAAALPAAKN